MALTDTQIKKAKAGDKPVKLFDGDGLLAARNYHGQKTNYADLR